MKKLLSAAAIGALTIGVLAAPAPAADYDGVAHRVKNIAPGSSDAYISEGVTLGSRFIFGAHSTTAIGDELWISDGSAAGTKLLKNINPTDAVGSGPMGFTGFDGKVYFEADDGVHGSELWVTDGTTTGTKRLTDINPAGDADPRQLVVAGGSLYFVANPTTAPAQLWKLSAAPAIGPPAPPIKVTNFGGTTGIENLTAVGTRVAFSSSANGDGFEPWVSAGTGPTTYSLGDLNPNGSSDPDRFVELGSSILFIANNPTYGQEVWKSNGQPDNAGLVKDINTGSASSSPRDLYTFGGRVLFSATPASNQKLWSTDGTTAGTTVLSDMSGGAGSGSPIGWTSFNGWVYFSGSTPTTGAELYRTKGVAGDVTLVKSFATGSSSGAPGGFRVVDGQLYFTAWNDTDGSLLWRKSATGAPVPVNRVSTVGTSWGPRILGRVSNTLFMTGFDDATGDELWAYTTRSSITRGYPKSSYSRSDGSHRRIRVTITVRATGTTPIGQIVLKQGSTIVGSGTLSGGKVSVRITKKLGKGKHHVRAYYSGSVRARKSYSTLLTIKVR